MKKQKSVDEHPCNGEQSCWATSVLARQKFNNLERWLYSEQVGCMGLRAVELGEELHGRELLRLLLQSHVESRGDGDMGPSIRVFEDEPCDPAVLFTHKRMRSRKVVTIFGPISVRRMGYGIRGEISIHPLDEQLQLPGRLYSYELQRRLVKKAVQGPFDEAIDSIQEATGVKMPKRTAEDILSQASEDFDSFYARRQLRCAEQTGPILVASIDCKGIPMIQTELVTRKVRRGKGEKPNKKRMATVATVFTQTPRIRTPQEVVESLFEPEKHDKAKRATFAKPENKRVWASLEADKDWFITDVYEEIKRRDPLRCKVRVVVTDGERALQIRVARTIDDCVVILDLLHVLEKLWMAGHALYGEGTEKAKQFVRQRALRILKGQVSQVVKGLRLMITKSGLKANKAKTLSTVSDYFYNNRSRMRYDQYLAQGLPIASGSVEGACKNLIKDRMERSGMRWSVNMAEAMVKMRALYLSGDFDEYWDFHVRQDQERLYPSNRWQPMIPVVGK